MPKKYLKNVKIWYAIIAFLLYMTVCFLIPTLMNFNNIFQENGMNDDIVRKQDEESNKYNVDTMQNIKLLLTENNQVVDMNIDDYLKGVLIGEVPVSYDLEALKAQAVVARTYTLYKLKNSISKHIYDADMCDDINCCQAYKTKEYAFASWDDSEENEKWAKYEKAVNSTKGEVITYNGELINAFFHAHSGGTTENVKFLWSKTEIPYLVSVSGNEGYVYKDSKSFKNDELRNILKNEIDNLSGEISFEIKDYTGSGRVKNIAINGNVIEGTNFRNLLGIKSTNFRIEQSGDTTTVFTVGYGHGVGMSQEGANQMSLNGNNYIDIIKHYYTGVDIVKAY